MKVVTPVAPVREEVTRLIRQDILNEVFPPGERLTEAALCERYTVSRTVIREALRQLESERLITMRPNRGPIVTVLTEHDIRSIYQVRTVLEGLAGELFALNATEEQSQALLDHLEVLKQEMPPGDMASRWRLNDLFYELLLAGTGNLELGQSLACIHARIAIFRHYAFADDARTLNSLARLTTIILAAARDHDPAAARLACETHMREAGELAVVEYRTRHALRSVGQNAVPTKTPSGPPRPR